MKLLVTGVAGFIGAALTRLLLDRGDHVIGIDNLNNYYDVSLKKARLSRLTCSSNFLFRKVDITDRSSVPEIFKTHEIDAVVNLAAQAGVRYSIDNPTACVDTNFVGFANILESCRQHSVAHLVYASSSSVYGSNTNFPFSEADNVDHPISLYAATKKANELIAHVYSHLYSLLDCALLFGPGKPLTVEIGFGDGQCLRQLANANQDMAYIGIESHRSGAGRLLMSLQEDALTNVKVLIDDAVDILSTRIASQSVDKFLIFFPDPWPKKRHHKRRLVNSDFLSSLARCLKPKGQIHIATDWDAYAKAIVDLIRTESRLHNLSEQGISPRPASRPETKYERRGVRLGHQVYDIIAQRCP